MFVKCFLAFIGLLFIQGCTSTENELKEPAAIEKANHFYKHGQYQKAIPFYAQNRQHSHVSEQDLVREGHALYVTKHFDQAQEILEDAAFLNPKNEAYLYLAKLFLQKNQVKKSAEYFEKFLANHPQHVDALNSYAVLLDMEKQHKKAQKNYLQALKYAGGNKEKYQANLGLSYAFDKNYKQAIHYLKPLGGKKEHRHNLALVYALKGDEKNFHNILKADFNKKERLSLYKKLKKTFMFKKQ